MSQSTNASRQSATAEEGVKARNLKTTRSLPSSLYTVLAALICVIAGLAVGFLLLLIINPAGAWKGICTIVGNFMYFPKATVQMKYFGLTLAKAAPLLMCALSVIYASKAGLFNIGVAGQYTMGTCMALILALGCGMPWPVCLLASVAAGALVGALCGALKVFCNVNEVISGILLNWIILYLTNTILTSVKQPSSPYTLSIASVNPSALLPTLGLDTLFGTPYAGASIIIALIAALAVWARFKFTRFGFELSAVGLNRRAAQCAGLRDKGLVMAAMAIAGALAGFGGTMLFLNGYEDWLCSQSSVPGMGFNGIAAAFLGASNPIGAIFASFFIQNITSGGVFLDTSIYSTETSSFIAGTIIYLSGFMMMIRSFLMKRHASQVPVAESACTLQPSTPSSGGNAGPIAPPQSDPMPTEHAADCTPPAGSTASTTTAQPAEDDGKAGAR